MHLTYGTLKQIHVGHRINGSDIQDNEVKDFILYRMSELHAKTELINGQIVMFIAGYIGLLRLYIVVRSGA